MEVFGWTPPNSDMVYAPGFSGMPVGYKGEPGVYAESSIAAAYTANLVSGVLSRNPDATISEILKQLAKTWNNRVVP